MKHLFKTKTLSLLLIFSIISCGTLFAVPAYPYPITFTQPDGDTLTVVMKGDEFIKFAETEDGYTLMYDAEGSLCYAQQNANGDIEPSKYVAKSKRKRTAGEANFLRTVSPNLPYSKAQLNIFSGIRKAQASENAREKAFPTVGQRKLLCILVDFKDKKFTRTQAEFNNIFNQVNCNFQGAKGSVRDYFLEASYGKLDLSVDVAGQFTASQEMAYYGVNDASGYDIHPRELVTEACSLAYNSGVDFSIYDNDKDGNVDGIYVIYAGYGEEAGGGADCIWAHAWSIPPVQFNGVWISSYSCSPELRGYSGTNITNIGVICHEFGHILGAPDYYDTDYGIGGQYQGLGIWDLQASGAWNDNGCTPAHPNPRSKIYTYNWATVTELDVPQIVKIPPSIDDNTAFYRINTATPGEYFLLENRQQKKFDTYLPGKGLMIYRCLSTIESSGNDINATHPQQFYPISANATFQLPTANSSTYGTINSESCPWPNRGSWPQWIVKNQFTDDTTPCMKSWANVNTGKPMTNIAENTTTGEITFTFMGKTGYIIQASASQEGEISPSGSVIVESGSNQTFTFTPNAGSFIEYVLVDGVNVPEAVISGNYTFNNITTEHTIYVKFTCFAQDFPVVESFDNDTFPPECWSSQSDTGSPWKRVVMGTYPACSPKSASGMLQYNSYDYYPSGKSGMLITPKIATDNRNSELTFWMYRDDGYSNRADKVNIYLSSTESKIGLTPIHTIHRSRTLSPVEIGADGWYEYIIDLPTASMSSAYVIFEGVCDYGNNIYLDDIKIEEKTKRFIINASAGSGGAISELGNITVLPGSNKTFTFTPNPGKVIEFVLVNGVNVPEAVASGSYTFTNVTENHRISVAFDCPAQNLPIVENFNDATFPSECWGSQSGTGSPWERVTTGTNPTCTPKSAPGMLQYDCCDYSTGISGMLITPKIATDNRDSELTFWMYRDNEYSNNSDRVNIYLSSTKSKTGITPIYTVHRSRSLAPVETGADGWYEYTINLPTASMSSAYVILEGVSGWGNKIYLDDIKIERIQNDLIIKPKETVTLTESVFNGDIIFRANDKDGVGQLIIDNGQLTINGVVKLEKEISKHGVDAGEKYNGKKKWYAIGFPFDIVSIQSDLSLDYGKPADTNYDAGDDFWLYTIKANGDFEEIIDEVHSGTTLSANQGYAIQFPDVFAGRVVSFVSAKGVILNSASGEIEIPISDGYVMLVNPSLADYDISCVEAQKHFYHFDGFVNFSHNHGASATLKPFESVVAYEEVTKAPHKSIVNIDGDATGVNDANVNDEIVDICYYNLQGIEISKPTAAGIYIVKKIYKSNKIETTKVIK